MDEDFTKQLQEEELAQIKAESQQTYTDKDGTVYEWDDEKKAWFPKIDEDFIANYQLNYGNNCQTSEEKPEEKSEKSTEYDEKAYEKYCRDYYNYYGVEYKGGEATSSTNEDSKSNINPTTGQPFKDNAEYYAYYYGEEYAEYYKNFDGDQVSTPGSNTTQKKPSKKELKKQQTGEKRKIVPEQEPATWFKYEADEGTHVYVSGLPSSITEEEFQQLMSKYGLIMFDPHNKKPKLKLYKDKEGNMKGDGLCCFIKKESVDLALKLLDGLEYEGCTVSVERAQFEMKGDFDPTKKKKKLSNKQKRKMKESQEKLFEWKLDKPVFDVRLKHERIVILKNMFDPKEFETDPSLINELREDVRTECSKFGDVRKVTLYDRNVEGTISVMFKTPEEADVCIEALHGRWFAKKQIHAETYDGKTQYEVEETEEEKTQRLKTWNKFLEGASAAKSESSGAVKPAAETDDAAVVKPADATDVKPLAAADYAVVKPVAAIDDAVMKPLAATDDAVVKPVAAIDDAVMKPLAATDDAVVKPAAATDDAVMDSSVVTDSATASAFVDKDNDIIPQESTSDSVTSTVDSHTNIDTISDKTNIKSNSNEPESDVISSTNTSGSND